MTSSPTQRLTDLGMTLPDAAKPSFDYVPVTSHAGVLYVSGQLPKQDGEVRITGRLGDDIDIETAGFAARVCVLQGLACAAEFLGGLDHVGRVLRLTGYVASTADFHDHPRVIDAASELIGQIFGEHGKHARSAVGVASLPRRSPVEIELILAATAGKED